MDFGNVDELLQREITLQGPFMNPGSITNEMQSSFGVSSHVMEDIMEGGFQLPCTSISWQEARELDVCSQNSCSYNVLSSEQELVSKDNYSLSCATGSSCVEILSPDNDSYRYLLASDEIPVHCATEEMPCFLATDTSISSSAEQTAFSDQLSKSALEWHHLQYQSLPGLLHVEIDPLVVPSADWNSSEVLLSSNAKPRTELLEDICTPSGGGGNNSSGCSAVSDMDTECTTMQSERRATSVLELSPSQSNSQRQQNVGEPMGFSVEDCNARTGDPSQLATACKRQRSCFTLEIVSESVHQHLQQHSGPLSCSANNLSEAMLQLNEACARPNPPLHGQSTGSKPRPKDSGSSVEPQSIAARQRRKRISERVRELEKLVPGGSKLDTASMLDEAIKFVKFLQIQVQLLEAVGHGGLYLSPAVARRVFPFRSSNDVSGTIDSLLGGSRKHACPLVLTETLQHALFKHKRCIATIEQCPRFA